MWISIKYGFEISLDRYPCRLLTAVICTITVSFIIYISTLSVINFCAIPVTFFIDVLDPCRLLTAVLNTRIVY